MMSDEEKKAIETLEIEGTENNFLEVRILLNLVEKQQKEIEELKSKYKDLFFQNFDLWEKSIFPKQTIEKEYISKDKIRERIKEYQEKAEDVKQKYKGVYAYKDDYLEALAKIEGYQELLEEK